MQFLILWFSRLSHIALYTYYNPLFRKFLAYHFVLRWAICGQWPSCYKCMIIEVFLLKTLPKYDLIKSTKCLSKIKLAFNLYTAEYIVVCLNCRLLHFNFLSIYLKFGKHISWLANSLEPDQTPSYSASGLVPSYSVSGLVPSCFAKAWQS